MVMPGKNINQPGVEPISAKWLLILSPRPGEPRGFSRPARCCYPGFFNIPMDHLTAVPILAHYFKKDRFKNAVVVSPDTGRTRVAAEVFGYSPIAYCRHG